MSPSDRRQQAHRAAHEGTRATVLEGGPEPARRRVQRLLEEQLQRIPLADRSPVACQAGCAMCCHLRVMVTPAEVFGLLDYLESSLDPPAFAAFRVRLSTTAQTVASLGRARLLSTNLPCPVLVDGRCSGYPSRPLNCRSYHSLDRGACQDSFEHPADGSRTHPQYAAVARVHEGTQAGFIAGLADAGYDSTQSELVSALHEAASDPDARKRFEARQTAFQTAVRL